MDCADPTHRRAVMESVCPPALDGGDGVPDCESNESGEILDTQLLHDAAAVRVDARRGDAETTSDFSARPARGDKFQDLTKPPSKRVSCPTFIAVVSTNSFLR